jgi:hypothetical protein
MMTITIELNDEEYGELLASANSQSITAEEMVRQSVLKGLEHAKLMKSSMDYVLQKNAELYRRLAK